MSSFSFDSEYEVIPNTVHVLFYSQLAWSFSWTDTRIRMLDAAVCAM